MAAEAFSGRHFGDDAQFDRDLGKVLGPHGIPVHGRNREGRLRAARRHILGEDAPQPVNQRDLLGRQWRQRFEQARQRFFDGNHDAASQSPDRPPDLRNRRKSVTTIPRSTALHIS